MSSTYLVAVIVDTCFTTTDVIILFTFVRYALLDKHKQSYGKKSTSFCKTKDGKIDMILIAAILCIVSVITFELLWIIARSLIYVKTDRIIVRNIIHSTYIPAIIVLITFFTFIIKRVYNSFCNSHVYALSKLQLTVIISIAALDTFCFILGYLLTIYEHYHDLDTSFYSTVFLIIGGVLFACTVACITIIFCTKLLRLAVSRQSMAIRTCTLKKKWRTKDKSKRKSKSQSKSQSKSKNTKNNININVNILNVNIKIGKDLEESSKLLVKEASKSYLSSDDSYSDHDQNFDININNDNCNTNTNSNSHGDRDDGGDFVMIREETVSLSERQTKYIDVISRMAILSAIESFAAIVLLSWTLVTMLTRLTVNSKLDAVDLVSLVFSEITDTTIVVCICLSFKFDGIDMLYKLMCGKCHLWVLTCCQHIALRKIIKRAEATRSHLEQT